MNARIKKSSTAVLVAALVLTLIEPPAVADQPFESQISMWQGTYEPPLSDPVPVFLTIQQRADGGKSVQIHLIVEPAHRYQFEAMDIVAADNQVSFRFGRDNDWRTCVLLVRSMYELAGQCTDEHAKSNSRLRARRFVQAEQTGEDQG